MTRARRPNPQPKSKTQPLIGYYDSDDPKVVRWHIQLAKAAGIDAFLVSWWSGANISGQAFEKVILPVAAEENFKVAVCSELAQFHHDVQVLTRQMSDVLRKTKDSPAYLRVDGKPLVYLYQVPFNPKLTPETFGQLCRGVEAEVGPVYWMMDKVTNAGNRGLNFPDEWLKIPEIQMFGFYGTFSIKRIWKYDDLASDYERLVQQAHAAGNKAFLPVHPGHDNSGFRPNDFFVIPRDNGATLRGYLLRGHRRRCRRNSVDQLQRMARDDRGRALLVVERPIPVPQDCGRMERPRIHSAAGTKRAGKGDKSVWNKNLEMRYPMSRLALIVVFVTAILAGVAANAAEPRRISHNESGSYEAFPDVCRLADGELVAVFYAGYGHISLPRPVHPRMAESASCGPKTTAVPGRSRRRWSTSRETIATPVSCRPAKGRLSAIS